MQYDIFPLRKGKLQLNIDHSPKYHIHTDYLSRSIRVIDESGITICKAQFKGWFFWKIFLCEVNKHGLFKFKHNTLVHTALIVEFADKGRNKHKIKLNKQSFGVVIAEKITWEGEFSDLELVLILCLIVSEFILNSPRNTFETDLLRVQ